MLMEKILNDCDTQSRSVIWKRHQLPSVQADASLLTQAFVNLIGNALKYTRPRNPAVIEIGSSPEDDEWIVFVRDNGVGFDPAFADRLFVPFRRLHDSGDFEGTGIGLANVRRIVLRHGGRVWAEGKQGDGATFYLTLPKTARTPESFE
jgi:signal transduction histidine kinase